MTSKQFLEDMIDSGEVVVNAKDLRYLLQKVRELKNNVKILEDKLETVKMLKDVWEKNYYSLLEEKRLKIDLKA